MNSNKKKNIFFGGLAAFALLAAGGAGVAYHVSANSPIVSAFAQSQTVSFVAGTDTGESSVTKEGITISMSTMSGAGNYRTYANTDMVVSSAVGNITQIVVTCTASGTSDYGPGKFSGSGYSYKDNKGTWTGSAESVTLSASKQVRMTKIEVTYDAADPKVAKEIIASVDATELDAAGKWTVSTGLQYKVTYEDDKEDDYAVEITSTAESGIEITDNKDGTASLNFSENGDYEIVITSKNDGSTGEPVSKAINVTVTGIPAVELASIAVTTKPTRLSYRVGDELDLSGMVVTATFNNESTAPVEDYSTDPASHYVFTEADLTAGKKTITVSYEGKTATFDVTVATIEGVLAPGRYFIANGDLALTPESISKATAPKAVSIDKAAAWDFELIADNTYNISFVNESTRLYLSSIDDSKGLKTSDTAYNWTISSGSDGKVIILGEVGREICYYKDTPDWRTYKYDPKTPHGVREISALGEADVFADNFLKIFTKGCNAEGGYDEAKMAWEDAEAQFNSLSDDLKAAYKAKAEGADEAVIERYDYIVNKYGANVFSDFMEHFSEVASGNFANAKGMKENNALPIIIISSIVTAGLAVGLTGYALKKRKKN